MNIDTSKLTVGEVELCQWQYGGLGSFKRALWSAIEKADVGHLALLGQAFPEQVKAYANYTHTQGYWVDVLTRAGLYTPPKKEEENDDDTSAGSEERTLDG